jgi:hypothetical protein
MAQIVANVCEDGGDVAKTAAKLAYNAAIPRKPCLDKR